MTTTEVPAPVRLDLAAAADAQARIDEGVALPGDEELAEQFEQYNQAGWLDFQDACYRAEREAWLATQCPKCEPEGSGTLCDECHVETYGYDDEAEVPA